MNHAIAIAPATPTLVRLAQVSDAAEIAALYVRVYSPNHAGEARDHYPFPQILEPDGVASLIAGDRVLWVVASAAGRVVGSAAAVRNIGTADDRIAEVFGVAVDASVRHQGAGSALLRRLIEELHDAAEFILCEARTAEAGGWKVARNAGFQPVGYAPYAHAMPIGFESMVLTGYTRSWNWRTARLERTELPEPVLWLAEAVLGFNAVPRSLRGPRRVPVKVIRGEDRKVRRNDGAGAAWFGTPADLFDRKTGVVGLCPLQGVDSRNLRFERPYYLLSSSTGDSGCARRLR